MSIKLIKVGTRIVDCVKEGKSCINNFTSICSRCSVNIGIQRNQNTEILFKA